jgi:putative sigma-54 modulation protein
MQVNVLQRPYDELEDINDDIEQKTEELSSAQLKPPKIIGTDTLPLKVLTADEAVMKMELSDDYFMVFRAEEDQKLKVIYRRADGHYGLIQTE